MKLGFLAQYGIHNMEFIQSVCDIHGFIGSPVLELNLKPIKLSKS